MKKSSAWCMLVPGLVILFLFLMIPLLRVLVPSVFTGDYPFSAYVDFFKDEYYRKIFLRTVKIAVITTFVCMVGGIPTAYFISRCDKKWRGLLLSASIFPMMTNSVIRSFAWINILGSNGIINKAMIAMGLICHPQLLIADEPTTALDVTIQAQILDLMKDLQKKTGMGIIFITHNLGVVADICDKVSVMYAGKIVEQGPVDDIFYEPAHPYTKGLLRSMPRVDAESYERLIPIEGTPVDMLNPPEGCPFAPRCEHAMKICLQQMPPYVEMGENHRAACWLRVQDCLEEAKKVDTQTENIEKTEVDNHE